MKLWIRLAGRGRTTSRQSDKKTWVYTDTNEQTNRKGVRAKMNKQRQSDS